MEWDFVVCSQRLGTIREIGPVTQKPLIITKYGSWIPLEDADIIVEREYPVYCPATKKFVLSKHIVYRIDPNQNQLNLKPLE